MYQALFISEIIATIKRSQNGYQAQFSVINKGRLFKDVLMYVEDISLKECFVTCLRHRDCKTVNYNLVDYDCEICAGLFDERYVDREADGWWHYGTPIKGMNYC